ncbi:MAG: helix-turn-helix domain-containing protein [Cyanobacteria bacterium SZAS TMP-1]|nr:helix-turn-helix domain-containing protein [Cyanobacteria bacterium SZAS TMP-1]
MLHTMNAFGEYIRQKRERLQAVDSEGADSGRYSLRRVAASVEIEPSYLSKIERGQQPPPGERTILALARELEEDPDVLLAMAGKVSEELQRIIRSRPELFAQLIRQLKDIPDHAVLKLVREVRDGDW